MKKQLLSAASILLATLSFGQIIPNGSFEDWSTKELYSTIDAGEVEVSTSNYESFINFDTLTLSPGYGDTTVYLENVVVQSENGLDTISAYSVWGNPGDDMPFPGGFAYQGIPKTFSASVRFKSDANSRSFFLVQFVKADTLLSFETFYIEGDSSNGFVDYTWDLDSLPFQPDVVVVGFAVNDLIEGGSSIPGDFMEVDYIRFDNEINSIPGGEFDAWKIVNDAEAPDVWTSYNSIRVEPVVVKSTMATEGDYSLLIKTIAFDGDGESDTLAGLSFMGNYDPIEDEIKPTHAFSTSGTYVFAFDYKYNQAGNDSGSVIFAVTRAVPAVGTLPIAYGNYKIDDTPDFATWTSTSFNVMPGDSFVVLMSSSDIFNDDVYEVKIPGSELWLDNMRFDIVTGLNPNNSEEAFTVFPNPSTGVFKYNFSHVENIERVSVVNTSGVVVYESTAFGNFDTEIDLSNQPNGVYNLVIDSSYGTTSRKMVKQ